MAPRNPEPGSKERETRRNVHEAVRSARPFGPLLARPSEELPRALRPREKLFSRGVRCLSSNGKQPKRPPAGGFFISGGNGDVAGDADRTMVDADRS